jgi:hypothetical protein
VRRFDGKHACELGKAGGGAGGVGAGGGVGELSTQSTARDPSTVLSQLSTLHCQSITLEQVLLKCLHTSVPCTLDVHL